MPSRSSSRSSARGAGPEVRKYIDALPPEARRLVRQLRDDIRSAAPDADEVISYGIPAFELDGRILVWYAGWKAHISIYPLTPGMARQLGAGIAGYPTSKGTIRFPFERPPSSALVRRIVRARVAEARAAVAAPASRRRTRSAPARGRGA